MDKTILGRRVMETLILVVCVAAFLFFAASVAWADKYTRDVRARWD